MSLNMKLMQRHDKHENKVNSSHLNVRATVAGCSNFSETVSSQFQNIMSCFEKNEAFHFAVTFVYFSPTITVC